MSHHLDTANTIQGKHLISDEERVADYQIRVKNLNGYKKMPEYMDLNYRTQIQKVLVMSLGTGCIYENKKLKNFQRNDYSTRNKPPRRYHFRRQHGERKS